MQLNIDHINAFPVTATGSASRYFNHGTDDCKYRSSTDLKCMFMYLLSCFILPARIFRVFFGSKRLMCNAHFGGRTIVGQATIVRE